MEGKKLIFYFLNYRSSAANLDMGRIIELFHYYNTVFNGD